MAGDVLNPTAGTALDCGLFNLGVFNPACWCLSVGKTVCNAVSGAGTWEAAQTLANPDLFAQQPPTLAKGGAVPTAAQLANTPPSQLPSDLVAQQTRENQQSMFKFFQSMPTPDCDPGIDPTCGQGSGSNWLLWVLGGIAVVAGLGVLKR
jgi:hypothetical protein